MSQKITIAIDGYSSTGKSTIAKQLAKELIAKRIVLLDLEVDTMPDLSFFPRLQRV